MCTTLNKES